MQSSLYPKLNVQREGPLLPIHVTSLSCFPTFHLFLARLLLLVASRFAFPRAFRLRKIIILEFLDQRPASDSFPNWERVATGIKLKTYAQRPWPSTQPSQRMEMPSRCRRRRRETEIAMLFLHRLTLLQPRRCVRRLPQRPSPTFPRPLPHLPRFLHNLQRLKPSSNNMLQLPIPMQQRWTKLSPTAMFFLGKIPSFGSSSKSKEQAITKYLRNSSVSGESVTHTRINLSLSTLSQTVVQTNDIN